MNIHETRFLLVLTVASFLMLAISLWVAWSVWREVHHLVTRIGGHMEGLMQKQSEVLQEVAAVAADTEPKRIADPESESGAVRTDDH